MYKLFWTASISYTLVSNVSYMVELCYVDSYLLEWYLGFSILYYLYLSVYLGQGFPYHYIGGGAPPPVKFV